MENRDRLKPVSSVLEPSCDITQPKNNVLELSFKTRRHFVFCSTATSPRRRPILGPSQGLRAGLKLDPLQDVLVSQNAVVPVSSSAMFLEDHDYSSPANRGSGLETGSSTLPVMPAMTKQKLANVVYSGLVSEMSQCSKTAAESFGDNAKLRYVNPVSDLMQAMCEEALRVECDVSGLGEKISKIPGPDLQGICDSTNSENCNSKPDEAVSTYQASTALTVKFQKLDGHKDGGAVGFENNTSAQGKNPILRSSWSSTIKQNSVGRTNRCVKSTYPDCGSSPGVIAGPSSGKYHLFKVDSGSYSAAMPGITTFCEDQPSYLSERPASGSLDSAQTGMIIPSPFLIQTGLEKTLDFAEFHPMSPSNKDWENEFCCPTETGLETPTFDNEATKTCHLSGASAFDGQDYPVHPNFSYPADPNSCMRIQRNLCATSDAQTTSAKPKQSSKWYSSKRQECLKVTFDTYPFTLEDLQLRRRKPVKRQLDFGSPVEISEEPAIDLDRKRALSTFQLNSTVQERQEQSGKDLQLSSTVEKQRARHHRRPKKHGDPERSGKEEFDCRPNASEKTAGRPVKRYRLKSEIDVSGAYSDSMQTTGKDNADQFNDPTGGRGTEQELSSAGHNDAGSFLQKAPACMSVDFCDVMSMVLDRWLEYLMTPHDVMHQQAIDDARYFGYNDDALDMISNGDLEVWRILEDMEPDFVRSGIAKYFL